MLKGALYNDQFTPSQFTPSGQEAYWKAPLAAASKWSIHAGTHFTDPRKEFNSGAIDVSHFLLILFC